MTDDQAALNNEGGEEAIEPTTPVDETKATEEVEVSEPEATVEGEEPKAETEESPKKGATQRIRELNSEKNREKNRADSLQAKLAELTGSVDSGAPVAPYTPQIKPGEEVTDEQFHQEVARTADSIVELKIKQNNAINRITTESQQAIQAYPELDPDSDSFDKELSDSITEATLAFVQANPYTASPKKFVDKLMKPYKRAVTQKVGQETANIAKQVAESATRPTSVSTKGGKSDAEKSIKELEAELGIVQV